jgi:hypothetical protein
VVFYLLTGCIAVMSFIFTMTVSAWCFLYAPSESIPGPFRAIFLFFFFQGLNGSIQDAVVSFIFTVTVLGLVIPRRAQ